MLLRHLEILSEARDPELKYTSKLVKNKLDRVTVELNGNKSGVMSRLTSRYARLDKAAKLMKEKRDELNAQMKSVAEDLFEAEDALLTRVVDTISFTITLSKAEKAADKSDTKTIDYEAIVKELSSMVPELEEKMKELTEKYTTVKAATDTPVKLTVKQKTNEGLKDSITSLVKSFSSFVKRITSWGNTYDKKLTALKNKAGV